MAICKDPNDPIQQNAAAIQTLSNDVSSDGTLLPSFINTAVNNFTNSVSATTLTNNPIDRFVNEYGREAFDAGLNAINDYLSPTTVVIPPSGPTTTVVTQVGTTITSTSGDLTITQQPGADTSGESISNESGVITITEVSTTGDIVTTTINNDGTVVQTTSLDLSDYEYLQTRLEQSPQITTIEYAEYMVELGTNPITVVEFIDSNPTEVQSQLDDFYQGNFTDSTIGSFCALMPSVFGAIENFFNLASSAINWFESLDDLTLAGTIDSLYNQIKSQITNIIDQSIAKVKSIVDNVVADLQNYIRRVQELIVEAKTKIEAFFSEENIERLKNKIQNAIDYVLNVFQNPSLEEIEYLIYRFCQLAAGVEKAINLLSKPLTDIVNSYQEIVNIVTATSRTATAEAVAAGGIRPSDEERASRINSAGATYPPKNLDGIEQEFIDEAAALTWERLLQSNKFTVTLGNNSFAANPPGQTQRDGWDKITLSTKARFIKLHNIYSGLYGDIQFRITSGYRGPQLNASIKGASRSQHLNGTAIDFQWDGFSTTTRQNMINIARERCGFGGIGVYNTFLHVDTGAERSWGG